MEGNKPISRHFFKVVMPGSHQKLSLPPKFCMEMKAGGGEELEWGLITSRKGSWRVKMGTCSKGFPRFEEGWSIFFQSHGLKIGDFVVFEHRGKLRFNAFVFGSDACEKHFINETNSSGENKYCPGKSPEEEAEACRPKNPHFSTTITPGNGNPAYAYLTIPADFARLNGLVEETNLILRDPGGGLWPVRLSSNTNGPNKWRTRMVKGWYNFYKSNNLKEGDVCTFHLLNPTSDARIRSTLVMDVLIFPL